MGLLYVGSVEYYLAIKKNEIWIKLEKNNIEFLQIHKEKHGIPYRLRFLVLNQMWVHILK